MCSEGNCTQGQSSESAFLESQGCQSRACRILDERGEIPEGERWAEKRRQSRTKSGTPLGSGGKKSSPRRNCQKSRGNKIDRRSSVGRAGPRGGGSLPQRMRWPRLQALVYQIC